MATGTGEQKQGGAGARVAAKGPTVHPVDPTPVDLDRVLTTRGKVSAFTVDDNRLMIKLNVSAISRMLVVIADDQPQFKTAVSLTMMAYNNGEQLHVRYRDVRGVVGLGPEIMSGLEFGLGEDAFEIEEWPFKMKT